MGWKLGLVDNILLKERKPRPEKLETRIEIHSRTDHFQFQEGCALASMVQNSLSACPNADLVHSWTLLAMSWASSYEMPSISSTITKAFFSPRIVRILCSMVLRF